MACGWGLGECIAWQEAASYTLNLCLIITLFIFFQLSDQEIFYSSFAQFTSFSLFITFSVFLKEVSKLGKEMECGAGMGASIQNGQFSMLLYASHGLS